MRPWWGSPGADENGVATLVKLALSGCNSSTAVVDVGSSWRQRARKLVGREGLGCPELLP